MKVSIPQQPPPQSPRQEKGTFYHSGISMFCLSKMDLAGCVVSFVRWRKGGVISSLLWHQKPSFSVCGCVSWEVAQVAVYCCRPVARSGLSTNSPWCVFVSQSCFFCSVGVAAEIQPPYWLRGQVLLLPPVPCCGLHGVETVLPSWSFEQVKQLPRDSFAASLCHFLSWRSQLFP